jgi:hypothetical protein
MRFASVMWLIYLLAAGPTATGKPAGMPGSSL